MNKVVWDGFDCGWLAKHCSVYTYTPVQTHFQNHSPLFQTAQSSPKQGKDIHVRLYDKLHCPVTHAVLLCHNHFHLGRTMQRGDAMYCERDNDPATMDVYTVLYCIHPWWQDHCYMYVLRHSSVTCQISFLKSRTIQPGVCTRVRHWGWRSNTWLCAPSIFENHKVYEKESNGVRVSKREWKISAVYV